jgi:hypothetical protein
MKHRCLAVEIRGCYPFISDPFSTRRWSVADMVAAPGNERVRKLVLSSDLSDEEAPDRRRLPQIDGPAGRAGCEGRTIRRGSARWAVGERADRISVVQTA